MTTQFKNGQDAEHLLTRTLGQIGLTSFREILPSMHDIFVESVSHNPNLP